MLNYEVNPSLLGKYVPGGTTLDFFEGKTYVSLVGFRFCSTRLLGAIAVPFHFNFEEINLRFYVHRESNGEDRRGVTFIVEVVPRIAVAATARFLYGENYVRFPMSYSVKTARLYKTAEYSWRTKKGWCKVAASAKGEPSLPEQGSLEQFITEHYWGYSNRNGQSVEYHVSHEPWRVWRDAAGTFEGDAQSLYGVELAEVIRQQPHSTFIADGSPVIVFRGRRFQ